MTDILLIDNFNNADSASNGNRWQYFSDRVMGGISDGGAGFESLKGRTALRLQGQVSLENNGGFVQIALNLGKQGESFDASGFDGIAVTVLGDGQRYGLHLRTSELTRPWQSYRASVPSSDAWTCHHLRFADFVAHRTTHPLDLKNLRRLGVIALGNPGSVDLAIGQLAFFREGFL